jgi:hypothetical protein
VVGSRAEGGILDMREAKLNPINEARWERLSPLAKSMIEYIVHSDEVWLRNIVEGEVIFRVGNRAVYSMTPAPSLKPGHGLPRL